MTAGACCGHCCDGCDGPRTGSHTDGAGCVWRVGCCPLCRIEADAAEAGATVRGVPIRDAETVLCIAASPLGLHEWRGYLAELAYACWGMSLAVFWATAVAAAADADVSRRYPRQTAALAARKMPRPDNPRRPTHRRTP